jgi:hypothetical protein
VAAIVTVFIWSSATVATLINTIYALFFQKRMIKMNSVIEADIDPVAALIMMLIWNSAAAAILINTIYAFTFSKKKNILNENCNED